MCLLVFAFYTFLFPSSLDAYALQSTYDKAHLEDNGEYAISKSSCETAIEHSLWVVRIYHGNVIFYRTRIFNVK